MEVEITPRPASLRLKKSWRRQNSVQNARLIYGEFHPETGTWVVTTENQAISTINNKIYVLYDTPVTTGLLRNFGCDEKTIQDSSYVTLKGLRNKEMRKHAWYCTGVLISPLPDQERNKLQRQKILIFIYPIYNNNNWRNICTIYIYIYMCVYIYNKTSIKRNILTIKKIHREVGRAKDLSAPL